MSYNNLSRNNNGNNLTNNNTENYLVKSIKYTHKKTFIIEEQFEIMNINSDRQNNKFVKNIKGKKKKNIEGHFNNKRNKYKDRNNNDNERNNNDKKINNYNPFIKGPYLYGPHYILEPDKNYNTLIINKKPFNKYKKLNAFIYKFLKESKKDNIKNFCSFWRNLNEQITDMNLICNQNKNGHITEQQMNTIITYLFNKLNEHIE